MKREIIVLSGSLNYNYSAIILLLFCINLLVQGNDNPKSVLDFRDSTDMQLSIINKIQANNNPSSKSLNINKLVPDSMLEIRSNGFEKEAFNWYYTYNELNQLTSRKLTYFGDFFVDVLYIELAKYDARGRILSFAKQRPAYMIYGQDESDSSYMDYYLEQYSYSEFGLVKKTIIDPYNYTGYTEYNSYYEYDNSGKLIYEIDENKRWTDTIHYEYNSSGMLSLIIKNSSGNTDSTLYLYDAENRINYIITMKGLSDFVIEKHSYSYSDTSKITTHYYAYTIEDISNLDTISTWYQINKYTETFDDLGRKTSEVFNNFSYWEGEQIYKAEYSYYENNDIKSILFSQATDALGLSFKETMKLAYYYLDEGGLLLFEKTYYDVRSSHWEILESETYYYPGLPTDITKNTIDGSADELIVYPNPCSDNIYLQNYPLSAQDDYVHYSIFNIQGVAVKKGALRNGQINVSDLNSGIYILSIKNNRQANFGRFIKK